MTTDIIDNRRIRVCDRLQEYLSDGACSCQLSIGYLFLDGFVPLQQSLASVANVEILIGNVVSRLTNEQIQEEADAHARGGEEWVLDQMDVASTLRTEHDRSVAETALNLRRTIAALPQTPQVRDLLLMMAGKIADGSLKIRLFTHGRLHAKLALVGYPSGHICSGGIAIVGSSNVSLGTQGHPSEMNVVVRANQDIVELSAWYRSLWSDSQDFHRHLFDELGDSWALG